jgi:hypothetical protein
VPRSECDCRCECEERKFFIANEEWGARREMKGVWRKSSAASQSQSSKTCERVRNSSSSNNSNHNHTHRRHHHHTRRRWRRGEGNETAAATKQRRPRGAGSHETRRAKHCDRRQRLGYCARAAQLVPSPPPACWHLRAPAAAGVDGERPRARPASASLRRQHQVPATAHPPPTPPLP